MPVASTGSSVDVQPRFAERLDGIEHGLVLDAARDDVALARRRLERLGGAAQREVVGLGAAAREHDLGRLRADELPDRRARLVEQRLGALPEVMDARRVAEVVGERAGHGLDDRRVRRGGGVVVEVGRHLEIWQCGNLESETFRFPNSQIPISKFTFPVSLSSKRTRHAPRAVVYWPDLLPQQTLRGQLRTGGECAMWKRDDAVKPGSPGGGPAAAGTGQSPQNNINTSPAPEAARSSDQARGMEKGPVNIGKSVVIKGELTGSEDLTIEGHVEGKIELRQNVLTIGPNGRIKAQVFAKSVDHPRRSDRQRHGEREGRSPRQRLGRRRHRRAARGDRRRRAFPRQHRHAARRREAGRGAEGGRHGRQAGDAARRPPQAAPQQAAPAGAGPR